MIAISMLLRREAPRHVLIFCLAAAAVSCATAEGNPGGGPDAGSGGAAGGDGSTLSGDGGLWGAGGSTISGPYALIVDEPSVETPCRLSADRKYLLVALKNDGSTVAGPTDITLSTEDTAFQLRVPTPVLLPGESVDLQFERGKVAGHVDNWSFQIEFDGDEAGPGSLSGTCRDLRHRARESMGVLQSSYNQTTGLFTGAGWWRGANMLETTIDYIRETGNHDYFDRIANTFDKNSGENFINDYYDDMGWWALTWIKAYDLTHNDAYLDMAKLLFTDMTGGWDEGHCDGGIYWQKASDTKVAIANELFLAVAARLHLRTPDDSGDGSYLDWAQKTWTWFQDSALLQADHQVIDSIDPDTCGADFEAKFTSNQGVIVGGLVDLWRGTGDQSVLESAIAIADAALENQVDEDGILIESSCHPTCAGGDDLLFKGIFTRNLAYLYEVTALARYQEFLIHQSDAIWERSRSEDNEFGQNWTGPFDTAGPARQSPALDAMIAAVRAGQMNHSLYATAEGGDNCGGPNLALDGNAETTKWCVGGDGHAITIDLGQTQEIIGLVLRHAADGHESRDWNTVAYDASISLDGETWTQIVEVTNNTAGLTRHDFPVRAARYVQVYVSDSQPVADFNALRIYEIEVLGHTRAPLK